MGSGRKVLAVEGDDGMREAIDRLLHTAGLATELPTRRCLALELRGANSGRGMRKDLLRISEGAQNMKREPRMIGVVAEGAAFLLAAAQAAAPAAAQ